MKESKRKMNVSSSTNGYGQKKKKITSNIDEQNTYFESETVYHSTVTRMKVSISWSF